MIKFVARLENLDQLEALLLVTKGLGVVPELGVETVPLPSKSPRPRKSTKRGKRAKPKRYSKTMLVKMGPTPDSGPPKLKEVHAALKEEFGPKPFVKGEAKAVLRRKLKAGGSTSYVTALMDRGFMVPA